LTAESLCTVNFMNILAHVELRNSQNP
jgi:hypothetical protein